LQLRTKLFQNSKAAGYLFAGRRNFDGSQVGYQPSLARRCVMCAT
jgi:hypothetical protein